MSINEFKFDKAVQSLNYLAKKENNKINKMKAIKLLYFADRYHIRKYGRPIFNDKYIAMGYGSVGSTTKDIVGLTLSDEENEKASKVLMLVGQYEYQSIVDVDSGVFSDSDIEAIDFAYNEFGALNQFELATLTHKYPEWKKFESELNSGVRSRRMEYKDFFENPTIPDDKFLITQKFVESSKDIYLEQENLSNTL